MFEDTKQAVESPEYFRAGLRDYEVVQLNEMVKEGKTAAEISMHFGVQLSVIQSFVDACKKEPAEPGAETLTGAEQQVIKDENAAEEAFQKAAKHGRRK
jgi:hypothetical protein